MRPELRQQIIAYNAKVAENKEKASDMDAVVDALMQMPFGQLKKVLTDDLLKILKKYGIEG